MVLDGLFEVHITVDPKADYVGLIRFVDLYAQKKGMKLVYAVSAEKNNQYMISYFTRKTDDLFAVATAHRIADEISARGMQPIRIKVEYHGAKGTPMTTEEYNAIRAKLAKAYPGLAEPYFEFHVKISNFNDNLPQLISGYTGVALSWNLCSNSRHPLLTIRRTGGFIDAESYKDSIMNALKSAGYKFEDKIQQEFSVYDNNVNLDAGWLK